MQKYEYNITLENRGDIWYYTVAQEIDDVVEFLGWGYAETAQQAAECVHAYIADKFA